MFYTIIQKIRIEKYEWQIKLASVRLDDNQCYWTVYARETKLKGYLQYFESAYNHMAID